MVFDYPAEWPPEGAVIPSRSMAYHPDFGDVGNSAVLLKHPLVVGEQQFEAEPEREDEGEPQQSAEDQRRQHGLTLGTERDMEAGQRGGGERTITGYVNTTVCLLVCVELLKILLMIPGAQSGNKTNIQKHKNI